MRQIAFRLGAVMLPLAALTAAEIVLRSAGAAENQRLTFIPADTQGQHLALNLSYVSRYLGNFEPGVPATPFAAAKPDSGFRVFVLGGSTTAGFPFQFYHGFPGRMELELRGALFGRPVEVVNLGMSAVNSFTVLDLGLEALKHSPDALIIYAGHNEFYGAFGTGSTRSRWGDLSWLKRLVIRLRKTVLFTLAEAPFADSPSERSDRTLMARMVAETQIPLGSPSYDAALTQYRENLARLFEAARAQRVPVYVGTLVSNLSGQPPLSSDAAADSSFENGLRLQSAGLVETARDAFVEARDLDGMRFRAPSAINAWLRQSARRYGVHLVDLEHRFREASSTGIEGSNLFVDHLHPNARGYAIMGHAFATSLLDTFGPAASNTALYERAMDHKQEAALSVRPDISLDPLDHAHSKLLLERLLGDFPFNRNASSVAVREAFTANLDRAFTAGGADSIAAMVVTGEIGYRQAQTVLTDRLLSDGDTLAALRSARALVSWEPLDRGLLDRWLSVGLANPAFDQETDYLALLSASRWDHTFGLNALAALRLRSGALEDAATILDRVERKSPDDPVVLFNKARLLILQGDTLGARNYFERYTRYRSN